MENLWISGPAVSPFHTLSCSVLRALDFKWWREKGIAVLCGSHKCLEYVQPRAPGMAVPSYPLSKYPMYSMPSFLKRDLPTP